MKNLFDETTLGGVALRNRAWRSATWLGPAGPCGEITEAIVRAYTELAKGGAAMLVTGLTSIAKDETTIGGEAKFYDDLFIAGHRRLTDAVHAEGAKIIMQTAMVDGLVDELATAEVEGVVRQFGEASARAERVGYDGVQIHAAHFFYLSKFISPLFNHRIDRFGSSPENRARILVEILAALSRPLICEPNLINRWQAGDIRPSTCVSCNACYRTSAHACLFAVGH